MKRVLFILAGIMCFCSVSFGGETGEAVFRSLGCQSCHHPDQTSMVNPSLGDIALAYQGKESQLIRYLSGMSEAIVRPEKSRMMLRKIEQTKALADADRSALALFIMSHQK